MSWTAFFQSLIAALANAAVGIAVTQITGSHMAGAAAGGLGAVATLHMDPPLKPKA